MEPMWAPSLIQLYCMNPKPHFSAHACPSLASCKYALDDTSILEKTLITAIDNLKFPAKIKIGISGCSRCCAMPKVRDLGFIAKNSGWDLYFGGNAGNKARVADCIATSLTIDSAVELAKQCLQLYIIHSSKKMRTATFMEKFGPEFIQKKLINLL